MSATKTRTEQDRAQREQAAEKRNAAKADAMSAAEKDISDEHIPVSEQHIEPKAEKAKPEAKTWSVLTDADSKSPVFKFTVTAASKKDAERAADEYLNENSGGEPVKVLNIAAAKPAPRPKAAAKPKAEKVPAVKPADLSPSGRYDLMTQRGAAAKGVYATLATRIADDDDAVAKRLADASKLRGEELGRAVSAILAWSLSEYERVRQAAKQ